jgi:hypothetical protein
MSRKADNQEGSLELLLDTICNTFGGILFISILVVILLNSSSRQIAETVSNQAVQEELQQWQEQLAQTDQALQTLEAAFREQEAIERQIVDPELRETMERLREAQRLQIEMGRQRREDLAQITQARRDALDAQQQHAQLQQQKAETLRQLVQIRRELDQEIAARTRAARLPRLRETSRSEVVFFLSRGRLACYARVDAGGNLVPNPDEVSEERDAEGKAYIQPKAGKGITVDPNGGSAADIDNRLRSLDSDQYYLAVFVMPNSFEHFQAVKERMVSNGFEYRLIPFPADGKVYLGDSDERALVQ